MENKSFRNCCFTLNNYTDEEYEAIKGWDCGYLIVGKEIGKEGTPHLQGYVEWKSSKRFNTLKKLNERIHWEERKGTAEQASNYCKKDDKEAFTTGTITKQGKRSDLEEIGTKIINGTSLKEIAEEHPGNFIRYHKGFTALKNVLYEDRKDKPTCIWRWGLTGVGKTKYCIDAHPNHYIKDGTMWWDGYEQQEAIIIDDFDGKWPFRDFLRLLDYGKYQGQYKGGYIKINSPFIYITCEYPPEHFWQGNELAQVLRRFNLITEVKADAAEVCG